MFSKRFSVSATARMISLIENEFKKQNHVKIIRKDNAVIYVYKKETLLREQNSEFWSSTHRYKYWNFEQSKFWAIIELSEKTKWKKLRNYIAAEGADSIEEIVRIYEVKYLDQEIEWEKEEVGEIKEPEEIELTTISPRN